VAARDPFPELVRPMLAVPGTLPTADAAGRWAYEMKWDGVRAVVYVRDGAARVLTRNDRDVTGTYPELTAMAAALPRLPMVLDGEVVALDRAGRPDFGRLQQRMHVGVPAVVRQLEHDVPVSYLAFDLLHLDGHDLTGRSYDDRRSLLEGLGLHGPRWDVPPAFAGAGDDAMAASAAQGLEGVVAKRRDSRYEAGRRSSAWLKVKHVRTQEVVVGGWRPGAGRRAGTIGSLLLGVPGPGGLDYAGHVGTGFTDRVLGDLLRLLRRLERGTSPFAVPLPRPDARDAVWVTPRLVGEVAFTEWTRDGRLRHPSWRGLRPDKSADEVVREP
jgi:bifunctional non-homologous end joining protein LigD